MQYSYYLLLRSLAKKFQKLAAVALIEVALLSISLSKFLSDLYTLPPCFSKLLQWLSSFHLLIHYFLNISSWSFFHMPRPPHSLTLPYYFPLITFLHISGRLRDSWALGFDRIIGLLWTFTFNFFSQNIFRKIIKLPLMNTHIHIYASVVHRFT